MRDAALVLHVLGWATWVGGQSALAGLLRRAPLYAQGTGATVGSQTRALESGTWAGVAMALVGAVWLLVDNPAWLRMGFVHVKLTLAALLLAVLAGPLRAARRRLPVGGPPLRGAWFHVSHLTFIAMVVLGLLKPF